MTCAFTAKPRGFVSVARHAKQPISAATIVPVWTPGVSVRAAAVGMLAVRAWHVGLGVVALARALCRKRGFPSTSRSAKTVQNRFSDSPTGIAVGGSLVKNLVFPAFFAIRQRRVTMKKHRHPIVTPYRHPLKPL
jgi:hypothetical protein